MLPLENESLMRGAQVIIPNSLRQRVMKQLHQAHQEIAKMKQLARRYFWWPSMNSDLEKAIKGCSECAKFAPARRKEYKPWPDSKENWEGIGMDSQDRLRVPNDLF
ncbi:hypothetical protein AB6A40_001024 [Gnathostoma spinigerum]|uniref:RNA-directed DNA polymerase n=1 Tax=Gnathostoma spinigerum TaxID=75299 RepID=A0ABD6E396_9BILA